MENMNQNPLLKTEVSEATKLRIAEAQKTLEGFFKAFEELEADQEIQALLNFSTLGIAKDQPEYQGHCGCQCGCDPQYPCRCKECDALQAEAYKNFHLFWYALHQAYLTAKLAGSQLEDSFDFLLETIEAFIAAEACSKVNCCKGYCKRR